MYFIRSSGHWKILYSFPSDLAQSKKLKHLASHLALPNTQKEAFKSANIVDDELDSMYRLTRTVKMIIHIQTEIGLKTSAGVEAGRKAEIQMRKRKTSTYSLDRILIKKKNSVNSLFISLMFIQK